MKIQAMLITLALTLAVIVSCVCVSADGAKITVSIANGTLVLTEAAVDVTDIDGDGALTINDALIAAHTAYYTDGADGYAAANGDYGLAITKLWGVENGGSYGYYVNNAASMGLSDPVKDGDRLYAFIYTDTTAFSDMYTFFDKAAADVSENGTLELVLSGAGYDENWNPVTLPVEGAVITVNGEKTAFVTDKDGKVSVKLEKAGKYTVTAVSDDKALVPAVCIVNVTESSPQTGDNGVYALVICGTVALFAATVALRRKNSYAE